MTTDTYFVFFESTKRGWYRAAMRFVTGCPKYHVGIYKPSTGLLYDMALKRRIRVFSTVVGSHKDVMFTVVESPVEIGHPFLLTKQMGSEHYGYLDYALFIARPIFHFFGATTRNQDGIICSEQCLSDAIASGWAWANDHFREVPSPCSLFAGVIRYFSDRCEKYKMYSVEGVTGNIL